MALSDLFIKRPVGTTLLSIGLVLTGLVAYAFLPVASLPNVDFPIIRVAASRPGADPEVMAASVAAPLERRLGLIAGVNQMTSTSTLGSTSIVLQFDLGRNVDGAARDVQAAINAAASDLPSDLPTLPTSRKINPAAAPVLILALTSDTLSASAMYDVADTVLAQRISQVEGVGEVNVSGADQPAVRIAVDPTAIAPAGISLDMVRQAIVNANPLAALGAFDGAHHGETLATNPQMRRAEEFRNIVVKADGGQVVRLSDIATVSDGTRSRRSAAWYNGKPAVLILITRQSGANVIATVDGVRTLLPELRQWIPAGVNLDILSDRTVTIRASIVDMQWTLLATALLVMLVVFFFLRRLTPTIAAGISVPLALTGTYAGMWLAGYSIDNLSLMALAISVGFVVDDAIVMIENMHRNLELGLDPLEAAKKGAREIGFTVFSISLSLIAAFTPLIFMGGLVGRLFREFSLTLTMAVAISTAVSLSVTPMICAHFIRSAPRPATRLGLLVERGFERLLAAYRSSLQRVLMAPWLTLSIFIAIIVATVILFGKVPKGYLPQDDTGLIIGVTRASPETSFQAMLKMHREIADAVLKDDAVQGVGSSLGGSTYGGGGMRGRMFISLKPAAERKGLSSNQVADRLRRRLSHVPGVRLFMFAAQDIRPGGRQSDSDYQYTLVSADLALLTTWAPRAVEALKGVPNVVDVSLDRDSAGFQLSIAIDRTMAARLGVNVSDIDNALNNAFAERQIATIYTQRNQYRTILEVTPGLQTDPSDLSHIYVAGAGGAAVPLSAVTRTTRTLAPLAVYHSGQYPSATISFSLAAGAPLAAAFAGVESVIANLHMPQGIRGDFDGNARDFSTSTGSQPLLIVGALIAVYIVLGVLYESLAHPLTIISTLPPAGLGALLALMVTGTPLTLIAFIGIILLIGIVKKNGIMIVDVALDGERRRGLPPREAVFEACIVRFRPILMTTMAAMLAAVPFVVAGGPGAELRRPLGITIIGGLIVSQLLTLYTTPVIYLMIDKARGAIARRMKSRGLHSATGVAEEQP